MSIKLDISKADLAFEAGFPKPEFGLLRDGATLMDHLYRRLERYGLQLTDIRFERGGGTVGDHHFLVYLFNYWMTIRIRVRGIEIICSDLPRDLVVEFKAAILDVLGAVKDYKPDLSFRAYTVAVGLHAKLEGKPVQDYLATFVASIPKNLGPLTASGVVFYFGPEEGRLLSTVTADKSVVVPDGLFVRVHGMWDAGRVSADGLMGMAEAFVRQALDSLGLQLPV